MTVLLLEPGDEALAVRAAAAVGNAFHAEAAAEFLAAEETVLLVALLAGEPAGMALGYVLRRLDGPRPKVFLYDIGTAPKKRRRGVGRALVEAFVALARARGARALFVLTEASNRAAMALYAATGGVRLHQDDVLFAYALDGGELNGGELNGGEPAEG